MSEIDPEELDRLYHEATNPQDDCTEFMFGSPSMTAGEDIVRAYPRLAARIRELEAENQELRKDLLFHAVVTEPFTESKCPECGAPAYRMGGQYMECHAGGCSRGIGGTPVLHREGGAK